jgi:hypothetical protein
MEKTSKLLLSTQKETKNLVKLQHDETRQICYWPPLAKCLPALLVAEEISKERKKCIYETGFHSDLLIHEKLRSEIIVKADFKSAIIIEKKKLLLINWKRK